MSANDGSVSAFAIYRKKMLHKNQPLKGVNRFVALKTKKKKTQKLSRNSTDSSNKHISNEETRVEVTKNKTVKIKKQRSLENSSASLRPNLGKKHSNKIFNTDTLKKRVKNDKNISSKKRKFNEDEEPPELIPISFGFTENGNVDIKSKNIKAHSSACSPNDNESDEFSQIISNLHKTDPSPEGYKVFKWLIHPLSVEEFFNTYWETEVLHIDRGSPSYFTNLLSTQRLDDIFREFPIYYNKNIDVVSYENGIKEVHNEEGRVVASALYDYYSNGCSIRMLNPQTYDQKVHLLISTLQEYFRAMVGTNVYLTPPGSQGFAPHYDDIEAFIVQLEGRKHWKLYKPRDNDVLARYSSPNFNKEELDDPFLEITLNAGDLLYFPRGTIHEGRTDEEAHSLHITVSVYQNTSYVDLLEHIVPEALKKAFNDDIEFRKGLPVNYLKHIGYVNRNSNSEIRQHMIKNVKMLMKHLIRYIDVDKAADKLGRKFIYDSMPPLLSKMEVNYTSKYDGDYMKDGKIFNRVEIGMDTEVRLVKYHCVRLVVEDNASMIYYNTDNAKVYHGEDEQFLEIDNNLIPCIEKLQSSYPKFIQVEDLPIKDNIAKAQLVSDLWERGLLVTNGPLPSFLEDEDEDDSTNSD